MEAAQRGELESTKGGLFAVVQAAFDQTEAISLVMNREVPRESLHEVYHRVVTQRYIRALEALPLFEFGAKGGVAAILSMRDQFLFLEEALELYLAGPWKYPELRKTLDSFIRPEDRHELSSALDRANAVLIHNVRVHLAEISSNYELIRGSMLTAQHGQS
ncbi:MULTISPECIES: hypothetical protein [unclassified Luteibacter]|uniref:hypothetical protein n=1 Tax=Luteibacter sp. PvP019 TaxID=3156436 RepID=UPI0033936857